MLIVEAANPRIGKHCGEVSNVIGDLRHVAEPHITVCRGAH